MFGEQGGPRVACRPARPPSGSLQHAPVVCHDGGLGGASDCVVVLEDAHGATCWRQHGVQVVRFGRPTVAGVHDGVRNVGGAHECLRLAAEALVVGARGEVAGPVVLHAVRVDVKVASEHGELGGLLLDPCKVVVEGGEAQLHIEKLVGACVHVVVQLLVVLVLDATLGRRAVAKVVAERDEHVSTGRKQRRLLAVLVDDGASLCRNVGVGQGGGPGPAPRAAGVGEAAAASKVKLAADGRVGAAGVRRVVRVEGEDVGEDAGLVGRPVLPPLELERFPQCQFLLEFIVNAVDDNARKVGTVQHVGHGSRVAKGVDGPAVAGRPAQVFAKPLVPLKQLFSKLGIARICLVTGNPRTADQMKAILCDKLTQLPSLVVPCLGRSPPPS
mmetsp:Transcript_2384/g.7624  ORF Transcript_2384/g.7624 Transcript_2384/m.7624 type:complete len:386 (+) Transcript_2384:3931-5088(+)